MGGGLAERGKVLGQYSDYGVGPLIEDDLAPDDGRAASEMPHPEAVVEHRDLRAAMAILIGKERAAEQGTGPVHFEPARSDQRSGQLFRFAQAGEVRVTELAAAFAIEDVG